MPRLSLLALLSLPLAWRVSARFAAVPNENDARLASAARDTALLHLVFGLLMTAGIVF